MSDATLRVIAEEPNVCRHIHLPVQSGSDAVLKRMNRKYDREWYGVASRPSADLVTDCAITTDIFAGYCGETEEDHAQSLDRCAAWATIRRSCSSIPSAPAPTLERMPDDVPEEVKLRRLNELIALQNELSLTANRAWVGREAEILVEGVSKRSREELFGRTEQNKVVIIARGDRRIGQTVRVRITDASSATLKGEVVED